jgi:hypothetical protein
VAAHPLVVLRTDVRIGILFTMSRWEIDLRYERRLLESDRRYLEVVSVAHQEVGYVRHRESQGFLVVTVETEAQNSQQAIDQAMVQSKQLWIHSEPVQAEVAEAP